MKKNDIFSHLDFAVKCKMLDVGFRENSGGSSILL